MDRFDRTVAWLLTVFCVVMVGALLWGSAHWWDRLMVAAVGIVMVKSVWIAKKHGVQH